ICMTCHNARRGLRNDDNFAESDTKSAGRAPHGSAQTDVLMGENAYLVNVGIRASHSLVEDTCVICHMEETPPPDLLSYNLGGTNHTFFASPDICSNCHGELQDADSLQAAFQASSDELQDLVEQAWLEVIGDLTDGGNTIDLIEDDTVVATITSAADIEELIFGETHGRQGLTVIFTAGTTVGPLRLTDMSVIDGTGATIGTINEFAADDLIKAGWNWNLANNDGSKGVHNPPWVFAFLDASIDAMIALLGG
ncbi:MAG: hypothetical protein JSU86_09235, partial [Phycisphaerales bacterium]